MEGEVRTVVQEIRNKRVILDLSLDEALYLLEQHAERGTEHCPINHSFCYDTKCVSCGIVKTVRGLLRD